MNISLHVDGTFITWGLAGIVALVSFFAGLIAGYWKFYLFLESVWRRNPRFILHVLEKKIADQQQQKEAAQ